MENRNHLRRAPDLPVEPLGFSVSLVDTTLIAILSGELDIVTAPRIVEHLETYRYRATRILYDLGGLTFLDGFGLRSLLGIFDGDLDGVSIANPSPPVRRVLEALGLGSMIEPWHGTLQADIGSIDRVRVDSTAND
ncbi:hypothetical protein BH18ACT5_BH18ACT5_01680 [soil metagenome]